jgi:hypothetical protein
MATPSQKEEADVRQRLIDFYVVHNPDKIEDIDQIMVSYRGFYEQMFVQLKYKYPPKKEKEGDDWVLVSDKGKEKQE